MNDGRWNSLRHRLVHERGVHPINGSTQSSGRHGCQVCRRDSQAVELYTSICIEEFGPDMGSERRKEKRRGYSSVRVTEADFWRGVR